MIKIDRKAHSRKGGMTKKGFKQGAFVKRTTYLAKDRGKKGRGDKLIKVKEPGSLGGPGFFSKPEEQRHKLEAVKASKIGEKKVMGKLQAVSVWNKRTSPETAEKAAKDKHWVAANFIGKKKVKPGEGLS